MDLSNLFSVLAEQPQYRIKQAKKAIYQDLIADWREAKILPAQLRNGLSQECPLGITAEISTGGDKSTIKALITLDDGLKIETVLLRHEDGRNTVCVSSQVGCPLGCLFCATGQMGFKRNLTADEIIEQVIFFARWLKAKEEKISNLVFMGMGEPLLNYDNVMRAIKIFNDPECLNLGARHMSISTAGIVPGIQKLASEKLQINLAISLHAPNDQLRSELMPIDKQFPLKAVLKAVDEYIKKTNRRVMFEYLMIKDVNDHAKEAEELSIIMKKPLYLLNLINYNPTGMFKSSAGEQIKKFKDILQRNRLPVTQRHSFGQEIDAACGQLAAREKKNTIK